MTVRLMLVLALSLLAALAVAAGAALYLVHPTLALALLAADGLCCLLLIPLLSGRIIPPLLDARRRINALRGQPDSAVSGNELRALAKAIANLGASFETARATLQHQAAQANQTLQSILQTLDHPAALLTPDAHVELANAQAVHIGLVPGRPADRTALPWLGPLLEEFRSGAGGIAVGDSGAAPPQRAPVIAIPGLGGEDRFLLPRGRALMDADNRLHAIVLVLEDITALRQVEQDQTALISGVSHDLKTPLTSIQMSVHLLLDDGAHTFSARQLELLRAARDDAERLHRLIEDWLTRARGGRMP